MSTILATGGERTFYGHLPASIIGQHSDYDGSDEFLQLLVGLTSCRPVNENHLVRQLRIPPGISAPDEGSWLHRWF